MCLYNVLEVDAFYLRDVVNKMPLPTFGVIIEIISIEMPSERFRKNERHALNVLIIGTKIFIMFLLLLTTHSNALLTSTWNTSMFCSEKQDEKRYGRIYFFSLTSNLLEDWVTLSNSYIVLTFIIILWSRSTLINHLWNWMFCSEYSEDFIFDF